MLLRLRHPRLRNPLRLRHAFRRLRHAFRRLRLRHRHGLRQSLPLLLRRLHHARQLVAELEFRVLPRQRLLLHRESQAVVLKHHGVVLCGQVHLNGPRPRRRLRLEQVEGIELALQPDKEQRNGKGRIGEGAIDKFRVSI